MELISVEMARAIWLFPQGDANPFGKHMMPAILALVERYKFADVPNVVAAIKEDKGYVFNQGGFTDPKHGAIRVQFGVYRDGLIGDTSTDTDVSDAFLDDVITWGVKDFGLSYPKLIRKSYVSRLLVRTDKRLGSLNSKLEKFGRLVSEKSTGVPGAQYEFNGLNFTTEQKGPNTPPVFRFERVEGPPYAENRYYSFAPMRTADHIETLGALEALLTK